MTNHIMTKLTSLNHDERHKYHHLATTLHLTLKMATAQVVETSVTNNSLSKDYLHQDDHAKQITSSNIAMLQSVSQVNSGACKCSKRVVVVIE